ncbi:MAG TPA: flagellar hook-basal body complex protein [Verrucomicrobiae bacterium]|nr:flagellar hook-basal body complex protein [Verrucomicrobiae bacterium]
MFQALFNSLSGLFSFSRSLDTVSNNVANMNTPGFRGGDSFFSNVANGNGSQIVDEGMRTKPGDTRNTDTFTNLAIDGTGFFVLRDTSGNYYYTRAGEFRFVEGILTDTATGYEVMAFDPTTHELGTVRQDQYQLLLPEKTTKVVLQGDLSTNASDPIIDNVKVYDIAGQVHNLTLKLHCTDTPVPGQGAAVTYTVTVWEGENKLAEGTPPYTIGFSATGSVDVTKNKFSAPLTFLGTAMSVEFNFGEGINTGVQRLGTSTVVTIKSADGHSLLTAKEENMSFDADGILQVKYSDTEKRSGPQIALARFRSEGELKMVGGRLIEGSGGDAPELGRPNGNGFGRIEGGRLEGSNVDLTLEFADMIIIQRGYQASSRVMTVSNEMIEQLYNSTRGG